MLFDDEICARKRKAKNQCYGALLGNNLYHHESCEVLKDLLIIFQELDDRIKRISGIDKKDYDRTEIS
jgi:hypothetical protein